MEVKVPSDIGSFVSSIVIPDNVSANVELETKMKPRVPLTKAEFNALLNQLPNLSSWWT